MAVAMIAFVEKYVFISWFLTTWKYWWNETVDKILPVFAQVNSLNFEFYFSRSYGKWFSVSLQGITLYVFSYKNMQKLL